MYIFYNSNDDISEYFDLLKIVSSEDNTNILQHLDHIDSLSSFIPLNQLFEERSKYSLS
jgi:hypothetical protein